MSKSIELLAPAGSPLALKKAISAGADAVYLSGKKFGARQFADNFSVHEIGEAVEYAHLRGVKVYITVNTLLKDRELLSVAEYVHQLYSMGVDAILVQDIGLSYILNQIFPDIEMHASTQMTTHNIEGLKWLEENGFSRVVLSRELHMDEIEAINKKSNLELEIFLHGALCYSYSGQCFLSSFIGGRSGNRGMCAQPCRKPYVLIYGKMDDYGRPLHSKEVPLKEKYIISPKDLCLYSHLKELVNSKISSLKIEGRMRSPEYVKTVTSIYKEALDALSEGEKLQESQAIEILKLAFNRGFTPGHLYKSKGKKLMGRDKPGHRGLFIGHMKHYNFKKREGLIHLKSTIKPEKGDGVYFVPSKNDKKQAVGMDIEKEPIIKGKNILLSLKKPVPIPSDVFLTRKKNISQHFENNQNLESHQFTIEFLFKLDENNFPLLKGLINTVEGNIIESEVVGKIAMEIAKTRPLRKKDIANQILKIGDKPFKGHISNIEYDENLFLPIKELNQLRRDLINDLEKKIIQHYIPSKTKIKSSQLKLMELRKNLQYTDKKQIGKSNKPVPPLNSPINLSIYVKDIPSLKSAIKNGFHRIYLDIPLISSRELFLKCKSPSKYTHDQEYVKQLLDNALELTSNSDSHLIWKWPNITKEHTLSFLKHVKKDYHTLDIMVSNPGVGNFIKKKFNETKVYGSSALNVWNHLTIAKIDPIFSLITLSPELSFKDINNICFYQNLQKEDVLKSNSEIEVIVQGNMESIISEDYILSPDLISKTQFSKLNVDTDRSNEFWGLKDELNHVFPLKISSDCQSIILNSVETCLVDQIPLLVNSGVRNMSIDGRWRGKHYVKTMGKLYQKAIQPSYQNDKKLEKIKKDIKKVSLGGITSFNFMRGVEKI